jgi:hypothetical protein
MPDVTARVYTEDLTIHLHTEDGKTHTVQDSPQVTPREMIRTLVDAHLIPVTDQHSRTIQWCLEDRKSGKTLDDTRTLQENGVRSGHHLHLRRAMKPDITIHLHAEHGRTQTVELSPQVKAGVMIHDLIRARIVPGVDEQGRPIEWCLDDKEAGKTLDNSRTLQENGLHSGHHLYFRRQQHPAVISIRLHIHTETGSIGSIEIGPTATTEQLIEQVAREFGLQLVDSTGRAIEWVLHDKDTAETLTPGKTLEEDGVLDGHHLGIRQLEQPRPILPPILGAVGLAMLVALGIWAWTRFNIPVEVTTSPSSARVLIDGKERGVSPLTIRLWKGTHQVEARKDPYKPASETVEVKRETSPIHLILAPVPRPEESTTPGKPPTNLPNLWLSTDLSGATVQLDMVPMEQAPGGGAFEQKSVSEGDHTIAFSTADGQSVTFGLKSRAQTAPEISNPTVPNSMVVIFVTSWNGQAQVHYSTPRNIQPSVQLDANAAVQLSAGGLSLSPSPQAAHTLTFRTGSQQWTMPLETSPIPTLAVFITGAPTTGTLIVLTQGVDGVQVFLNNANRGSTTHGKLPLSGLPAGSYTVAVTKEGYESSPPLRHTQLPAGGTRTLSFNVIPRSPLEASLRIRGAIPGSRVFLDGSSVGIVGPTGSFDMDHINLGHRTIKLEQDRYQPWQTERSFVAGQAVSVVADQQKLWVVLVDSAPLATRITYHRVGDVQDHEVPPGAHGQRVLLLPGSYTFTAYWNDIRCVKPASVQPTPNDVPLTLVFHPNCN